MSKKQKLDDMPMSILDFARFVKNRGYTFQYNLLNGYDVINRNGKILSKSTVSILRKKFYNSLNNNEK